MTTPHALRTLSGELFIGLLSVEDDCYVLDECYNVAFQPGPGGGLKAMLGSPPLTMMKGNKLKVLKSAVLAIFEPNDKFASHYSAGKAGIIPAVTMPANLPQLPDGA